MKEQDIIQFLRQKTIKAQTQIATDFINRAVEKATEAAELGYEYAIISPANGEIVNQYKGIVIDLTKEIGFEYENDFYITHPVNMNHIHADEKLRELGFKTQFKDECLSKISW